MTDLSRTIDMHGSDILVNSIVSLDGVGTPTRYEIGNGVAPTSVTTTTTTITAAIILGGIIVNSAASAVTATLDTAANLLTAINANYPQGANVGDLYAFEIINGGNTSGAITVGAGSGGTFDANVPAANKVVAINTARTIFVRMTNVTPGSAAYVVYM
jgi:hypothetical protein